MKILALGDVHLGASPDLGRVPFGPGSRLLDQRNVLVRIARLAEEEQCDLVLFAGDAFHRRRPTPSEILVWREFVDDVTERGMELIACDGNHDVESAERPSALELVKQFSGYQVSRTPQIISGGGLVRVATLPWTPPARLIASLNGSVERDEVNARVAELLIDSARELREQMPETHTKILLAHWSVSGSSLPNGLPVDLLREPVLPLSDIEALGFDAVVLGHIHKAQVLSDDGRPIFYTGSPAVVDFGEAATEHGVWILDTDDPLDSPRFVPIEDRRFVTVDADIPIALANPVGIHPTLDPTDIIAAAIAEHFPLTDAVVRIKYRATSEQARRVDVAALRGLCADAGVSKVFGVYPDIVREDRARVEGVTETLSVPEALDLYLEHNEVGAHGEALRVLTASLLEEVEA